MYRNVLKIYFVLSLFLVLSCEDDTNVVPQSDFKLTTETIVLDQNNMDNLMSFNDDVIIFNNQDSTINSLEINNIIVSDINVNAPLGFLKKIINIEYSDNAVILTTTQASITDAVIKGTASLSSTISPSDIIDVDTSGVEVETQSDNFMSSELSFEINRTFDLDGDSSTTNDRIKFEGNIDFEPSFVFDIDIDNQNVEYFLFKFLFNNNTSLLVEYDYSIEHLGINKTYVLKTITLSPQTVWLGSFPIVLSRRLVFVSGIDGSVSAQILAEATNTYTAELGIEYIHNSGWHTIQNQVNSLDGSLSAQLELSLEGWVQPRFELRPYGLNAAKLFLAAKGGLKSEVVAQNNILDASLDFTTNFTGKAVMNVFSSSIINYEQVFWSDIFPIWSDSFPNNTYEDTLTRDLLTGGDGNSKSWRLASSDTAFGIGFSDTFIADIFQGFSSTTICMSDDVYTFSLNNNEISFASDNQGVSSFNEFYTNVGGGIDNDTDQCLVYDTSGLKSAVLFAAESVVPDDITTGTAISISDDGFLIHYIGASSYEILNISENSMRLRALPGSDYPEDFAWYFTLVLL